MCLCHRVRAVLAAGALLLALGACRGTAPVAQDPAATATATATGTATAPVPPIAERRDHFVRAPHGATRNDPYYWLRDDTRSDAAVLSWLQAENDYADAMLAPLQPRVETLYAEIVARIPPADASVPYRRGEYWYYTRYEAGQEYPIHARRRGSMDEPEQIVLDGNALAAGHAFHQIGAWQISPDHGRVAWAEDVNGRRQFILRIKDIDTGYVHADTIEGATAGLVWGEDSTTLYYIENDPVTLLSRRVKRHVLGTPVVADELVYEERDDSFYMSLFRTRSERFVCIDLQSTVSSEARCAPSDGSGAFRVLAERERDVEYHADHLDGRWVIRTNWQAPNYRLMQADESAWGARRRWRDWIPHRADVLLEDFVLFDDFLALAERAEALLRLRVVPAQGESFLVEAAEPAYAMDLGTPAEPDSSRLRYVYSSMTAPPTTFDVDVTTGTRELLKREPVPGDFDPANYETTRTWATARDGERVPVSLAWRRGIVRDGSAPLLQRGYGSYGSSSDPRFDRAALSLMDRGVVIAIAHVRGGQELGRDWYERGRLMNKLNTFTDFIDVTDHLVAEGFAAKDRVAASGRSAGGLLMGAIANMAPERYAMIHTAVPFVDVVTTMLDASIPLTTNEYDEWGDPADPSFHDYMLAYSPYDQVAAQEYPAIYVSTGLWDSQVQYYEPAKWVAKLRATKTDTNPLLFRTNMDAGHGGASGRFRRQRETAEWYAFLLDRLGVDEPAEAP